MRQGRNNEILKIDGKLIGVNLGADYVAEHEWGIKGIRFVFGSDVSKPGLEGRQIAKSSNDLRWVDNTQFTSYVKNKKVQTSWSGFCFNRESFGHQTPWDRAYPSGNLITLWDQDSFCALANNADDIASLKEVFEAFSKNDIAIWLGGGGVFQNSGLCIGIASHLSEDVTKAWYNADIEAKKLRDDMAATGIEEKLKAAGKHYFALKPKRKSDGGLEFWLNPENQDRNNSGWYDLCDLEAWIENKGPIIKGNKRY